MKSELYSIDLIRKYFKKHTWKFLHEQLPLINCAHVKDLAGLIGAAYVALSRHK